MFGYFRLKRELKEMKERYNLLNDKLDLAAIERELFNHTVFKTSILMREILASLDEREELLDETLEKVKRLGLKLEVILNSLDKENSTDCIIN